MDILFLAIIGGFCAVTWGLLRLCASLRGEAR